MAKSSTWRGRLSAGRPVGGRSSPHGLCAPGQSLHRSRQYFSLLMPVTNRVLTALMAHIPEQMGCGHARARRFEALCGIGLEYCPILSASRGTQRRSLPAQGQHLNRYTDDKSKQLTDVSADQHRRMQVACSVERPCVSNEGGVQPRRQIKPSLAARPDAAALTRSMLWPVLSRWAAQSRRKTLFGGSSHAVFVYPVQLPCDCASASRALKNCKNAASAVAVIYLYIHTDISCLHACRCACYAPGK